MNSDDTFRHQHPADVLISHVDQALNNIFVRQHSQRPYPAEPYEEEARQGSRQERRQAAAMMRVNHAGEMAAQALYHGQSLMARDPAIAKRLQQASIEESDHLNWCRRRLDTLDARPSRLDPLWYAGSFAIGVTAGAVGDQWNLGFLEETEKQVVRHLDSHLARLPAEDRSSRSIIEQMREDELGHARLAASLGAAKLPSPVRALMRLTAKIMTTVAARI